MRNENKYEYNKLSLVLNPRKIEDRMIMDYLKEIKNSGSKTMSHVLKVLIKEALKARKRNGTA